LGAEWEVSNGRGIHGSDWGASADGRSGSGAHRSFHYAAEKLAESGKHEGLLDHAEHAELIWLDRWRSGHVAHEKNDLWTPGQILGAHQQFRRSRLTRIGDEEIDWPLLEKGHRQFS